MGVREQIVFLGVILFVIIVLSLSMPSVQPYHKDTLFSKEFPYEGFSEYGADVPAVAPANAPANVPAVAPAVVAKVEGFEGLQPSPLNGPEKIDVFSSFEGKSSCSPSPYTNSMGYLCMDKNAMDLLLTRGGNATGNPSQIG
jgi:hypothetical protein